MKNNKTTVNSLVKSSQVKSSQVKSSAKIVSLINNSFKAFLIALFILLFSISCKSNENPKKVLYKVSDIEGTWRSATSPDTFFTISGNGYLDLTTSQGTSSTYISGYDRNQEILEGDEKLEIYVQVNLTSAVGGGTATLTLTFNSASNCTASLLGNTEIFIKQ